MAASTKPQKPESEQPDLEAEIAQLKADIAKLMEQLRLTGEHGYGTARRVAAEGVEQLRSQGESYYSGLRTNAEELEAQLAASVREKPLTALAVAAGIGFLFALFARR